MKKNHYWVDLRIGCIAVRDDRLESGEENCLSPDMKSVVWFREGNHGENGWYLPLELETEARKLCDKLNEEEK